ncbi:hypothetical protein Tco_1176984 [Tanacetum coccineum]
MINPPVLTQLDNSKNHTLFLRQERTNQVERNVENLVQLWVQFILDNGAGVQRVYSSASHTLDLRNSSADEFSKS